MRLEDLSIENARIGFRNFAGAEGKFNAKGKRNFCVFLEEEQAEMLALDGWLIKWLKPKEDGDREQAYLQVAVAFANKPPNIWLVTKRNRTRLDEDSVRLLDWAEVKSVDLTINPYHWEVGANSGIKAFIKSMFVTIHEDTWEDKYKDVPDSAMNVMGLND